jgi:hypothetical protein
VISASAPGTVGASAPQPTYPAVYVVRLNAKTKIATVHPLYDDESTATALNGPHEGKPVQLALTDPDSNEVVPPSVPRFGGDFMLASQGDEELIFGSFSWWSRSLSVLSLTASVDDSSWITAPGAIYVTDNHTDTVDAVTGAFKPAPCTPR